MAVRRVMVVDDDPSVRYAVDKVLTAGGMAVQTAAGGPECLDQLSSGFRGVILMDIMMPGMDGWDTIDAVLDRGLADGNIICMLTAVHTPGPRLERLKEHVLDYVRKPFEPNSLRERVGEYFELTA